MLPNVSAFSSWMVLTFQEGSISIKPWLYRCRYFVNCLLMPTKEEGRKLNQGLESHPPASAFLPACLSILGLLAASSACLQHPPSAVAASPGWITIRYHNTY